MSIHCYAYDVDDKLVFNSLCAICAKIVILTVGIDHVLPESKIFVECYIKPDKFVDSYDCKLCLQTTTKSLFCIFIFVNWLSGYKLSQEIIILSSPFSNIYR
jgi:hypothetical protein